MAILPLWLFRPERQLSSKDGAVHTGLIEQQHVCTMRSELWSAVTARSFGELIQPRETADSIAERQPKAISDTREIRGLWRGFLPRTWPIAGVRQADETSRSAVSRSELNGAGISNRTQHETRAWPARLTRPIHQRGR